jgi:hypothetical protein
MENTMTLEQLRNRIDHLAAQLAIYDRERLATNDDRVWLALTEVANLVEEDLITARHAMRILERKSVAAFESAPIRFTDDVVATD